MCGICGFYNITDRPNATFILENMALSLLHRGPDGKGMWIDNDNACGLANTRLAVIDVESGKQPIQSFDGRYVIVLNGEIYNYKSLRIKLKGKSHRFRTKSDTEVLLGAYMEWGTVCLDHIHGMFAFAIYDIDARELFIARDQTGIKPIYYYAGKNGFFFGSELKAILSVDDIPRRINYKALADFFTLSYPLLPTTFFSDIYELEPGSWLKVSRQGISKGRYWKWERIPTDWSEPIALENTEIAIEKSLQEHLVSDVPVGAFLSGGIDSSLLVAILVKKLGKDIETFNVSFGASSYDESPYARMVAEHLGTCHHEVVIDMAKPDISLVDEILHHFDQPFGDSSAIPTFLICREIRKHVKVAISGDGGDEMFGGYRRFFYADMAKCLSMLPIWCIKAFQNASGGFRWINPKISRQSQRLLQAARLKDEKRLLALSCYTFPEYLPEILDYSAIKEIGDYVPSLLPDGNVIFDPGGTDFIDSTILYALPGDYLRKVDMMSSAHGLEVRVPFLGVHVLECAARIPSSMKYSSTENKILLRKLAKRYLPKQVVEKPKAGFGIPLDSWLGKDGREEIRSILGSTKACIRQLVKTDYLDGLLSGFVEQRWNDAIMSRYNMYQQVYFMWSLERWLERWKPML